MVMFLSNHPTFIAYLLAGMLCRLNYWKSILLSQAITSIYHQEKEDISEEQELIEACKKDPRHFSSIYEKYYESIFGFVYKRVDDEYVTSDITSKIFFNCLKNLHKYKFQGVPFASWLYKIAINEVNQFFRAKKSMDRTVSLEDKHVDQLIGELEYSEPKLDPNTLVTKLLETLNPDELQLLELRFFEGCSFKEVGYLTGNTEVNAKVKTYRILNRLKERAKKINM